MFNPTTGYWLFSRILSRLTLIFTKKIDAPFRDKENEHRWKNKKGEQKTFLFILFPFSPQFLGQKLYRRTVFDFITYIQDQFKGSNIIQKRR